MLLMTIVLAIYPTNRSWGYVMGGSIGFMFFISWLTVMLN